MSETAPVTFYVPAYNAGRYLPEVIPGILAQTVQPQRILIIDDGSTDDTAEIASRYPVELVRQPQNMGLAAGRNRAIEMAETELIAAIDSDVVLRPTWLATMLGAISASPRIAAVTGFLEERYQSTPADKWRALHMKQNYGPVSMESPGPLSGSNHILRKAAWAEVGGFNVIHRTHSEDTDISRRLREKGWGIAYEARARAEHLRQDTFRSIARAKWGWDYWPKLANGHYQNRIRVLSDNLRTCRWRLSQHLARPYLMLVDVAMLWWHTAWDFEKIPAYNAQELTVHHQ